MDTDHYGPPLPPQSTQSVQSEHASRYSHSTSSEENESSVPIKKSTKPQQKAPPEPDHQVSTDPVFYREVDMSDMSPFTIC